MQPLETWDLERTWATFEDGSFAQQYRGLELQKSEFDLDRYRWIVEWTRPDIVIETGTRYGASARWFHEELGLQVITIDVSPQVKRGFDRPGLLSLKASSISDWAYGRILKSIGGKRVMVSLDSDHHSAHVQAEIARYAPLVSRGCFLVVEDACFDAFHRAGSEDRARVGGGRIPEYGGPLDAIEKQQQLLNAMFARDIAVEGVSAVSHSPCGWWRRHDG